MNPLNNDPNKKDNTVKSWEEEKFKKEFENVFNPEELFYPENREPKFSNDMESIYFINKESSFLESSKKLLNDIEEKIKQINSLSDINITQILIQLDNIYENNKDKEIQIKSLFIQKKLLNELKERTCKKIEEASKKPKNSSTKNDVEATDNDK